MNRLKLGISALCLLLVTTAATATTFVNRTLGQVTQEAQYIVRGTIGESYADWGKGTERAIYTYTELQVSEVMKGNLSDPDILLREAGGAKDGVEMMVPGSAHFSQGEDVVVLLGNRNSEDGSYDVPGLATGKYSVVTQDNGEPVLINSLGGGAIYDPKKEPKTLSYNSKIPITLFRKVAQGVAVPEATQSQYKSSKAPPPPGAADADNDSPLKASPMTNNENTASKTPVAASRWHSAWLPIGLAAVCLAVALFFWAISSKL